ncbi:MAG: dTDP-4-dehydrorhamnose 3,5-epimerase [Microvirga sp.]
MSNFASRPLEISDLVVVVPRRFGDERGYFMETFNRRDLAALGITAEFLQDNQSLSVPASTVRGLHFQLPPAPQAKLVRVLRGSIFDVAVDLRKGSPSYLRWCGVTLSAGGGEQLYVPRGFAHGFCTLEPETEVAYKVDGYYAPECDSGLLWNDPDLGIAWPIESAAATLSDKDRMLPRLRNFVSPFTL